MFFKQINPTANGNDRLEDFFKDVSETSGKRWTKYFKIWYRTFKDGV